MAIQKIDLPTDSTMRDIAASLRAIAGFTVADLVTMRQVKAIVEGGKEKEVFAIGDQIVVPWTDVATKTTYAAAMDIVHFGNVELADGETVNAMFLQWHYATPFGICYDAAEVEVATEETFSADYNYYTKNTDGSYSLATVSTDAVIPKGTTYYHNEIKDSSGNICRYGYNRWGHSTIRQWLNSTKGINEWWTAQHKGDVKPAELATKAGFLTGFDEDFIKCLTPIKVTTNLNTISEPDKTLASEITYDKVFLPSMEQMYCTPQGSGEGDYWEYWKRASERTEPCQQWQTYPEMVTYSVENNSAAQSIRLRSASNAKTCNTWYINDSGYITYADAKNATMRCTPAFAITGTAISK